MVGARAPVALLESRTCGFSHGTSKTSVRGTAHLRHARALVDPTWAKSGPVRLCGPLEAPSPRATRRNALERVVHGEYPPFEAGLCAARRPEKVVSFRSICRIRNGRKRVQPTSDHWHALRRP